MKFSKSYFIIFLCAVIFVAAKTSDNTYRLGDKNDVDKRHVMNIGAGTTNPFFGWSTADQALVFSNDGAIIKKIGSGGGGGGGTNFFLENEKNFTFDDNIADWAASGGGFQHETGAADILKGGGSASWDPSAASQNLDSDLQAIPNGFKGRECALSFLYKWAGTAGDIKLQALDQASNILATIDLAPSVGSVARTEVIGFVCPTGTDTVRARLTSTADAIQIFIDDFFIGENLFNTFATAEIMARAHYPSTGNCVWSRSTAGFGSFPTDADCVSPIVDFLASDLTMDLTDDDLPTFKFNNLPPGNYEVKINANIDCSPSGNNAGIGIFDGTTIEGRQGLISDGTSKYPTVIHAIFTYTTTQLTKTFEIQGERASCTAINLNGNLGNETSITLIKYPLDAQKVLRVDQVGWFVDVNIGGATINLGTGAQSSYVEITNASLDLVVNPGSIGAEIPCSGTNPSTGLTCSVGSESIGVVFDLPIAGLSEACISFSNAATGTGKSTFQMVETPNNAQTISQEGNDRQGMGTTSAGDHETGVRTCGIFDFVSAGQKTLRLMFEQDAQSAPHDIRADRLAALGQRDIHITVRPITQNSSAVRFPELVITKGANQLLNLVSAKVDGTGTPAVVSGSDFPTGWISSVTDNGPGDWTLNFAVGTFSSTPVCSCTAEMDTNSVTGDCIIDTTTAASSSLIRISGHTASGGARQDQISNIICHGPLN